MSTLLQVPPPKFHVPQTMGFNGCVNCKLLKQCGGHQQPIISAIGCANFTRDKDATRMDDMNPNDFDRFIQLWDDVGGLVNYSVGPLCTMHSTKLPRYVPQLQGRHLHPPRPLDVKVVALRLFQ